jgi:hypothetical protein
MRRLLPRLSLPLLLLAVSACSSNNITDAQNAVNGALSSDKAQTTIQVACIGVAAADGLYKGFVAPKQSQANNELEAKVAANLAALCANPPTDVNTLIAAAITAATAMTNADLSTLQQIKLPVPSNG